MKNNLAKKIFGTHKTISRGQFDAALQSGDEIPNDGAQLIIQSDFEKDAFDGFDKLGLSTRAMNQLDRHMMQHFSRTKNQSSNSTYIIGMFLLVIMTILIAAFLLNKESRLTHQQHDTLVVGDFNSEIHDETSREHSEKIKLTDERFIVTQDIHKKSNQSTFPLKNNENEDATKLEAPIRLQPLSAIQLDQRNRNIMVKKAIAKEISLSDFIFVDYRGIRVEKEMYEPEERGTRANLRAKNETQATDFQLSEQKAVSYHIFLEETAALLKLRNWNVCSSRFSIILKHYPEDINALFYMAFIKFNTADYGESLKLLERLDSAYYGNFEEEKDWYKLKNYVELKNYDMAQKMAQKIIDSEGFYQKQSEELLKTFRR